MWFLFLFQSECNKMRVCGNKCPLPAFQAISFIKCYSRCSSWVWRVEILRHTPTVWGKKTRFSEIYHCELHKLLPKPLVKLVITFGLVDISLLKLLKGTFVCKTMVEFILNKIKGFWNVYNCKNDFDISEWKILSRFHCFFLRKHAFFHLW